MATIEEQMLQASAEGNLTRLNTLISNTTAMQAAAFDPLNLEQILGGITSLTYTRPVEAANSARLFMAKFGLYTTVQSIEYSINDFAHTKNLAGVDAVTDNLTAHKKAALNSFMMGGALVDIVSVTFEPNGDVRAADAARDFLAKKIPVHIGHIEYAILDFAHDKNLAGVDAVTDNLTAQQKAVLNSSLMGQALVDIVSVTYDPSGDVKAADAVRDFLAKKIPVDTGSIEWAILDFAHDKNLAGVDAVTDNLTAQQKALLDQSLMGQALLDIVLVTYDLNGDVKAADAVRDFLVKKIPVDIGSIELALADFAHDKNLGGVDAITDNLTAQQKAMLNPILMGAVLENIVSVTYDPNGDVRAADAVRDFMAKKIPVDSQSIEYALTGFANDQNLGGIDAITDNLNIHQKVALNPFMVGQTLQQIADVTFLPGGDVKAAEAAYDFILKGLVSDSWSIRYALDSFRQDGNHDGMDAILNRLSATQYSESNFTATDVTLGTYNANAITGTSGHDAIFGLGGNDTLRGGIGNDKLYGDAGNDTLFGDAGADLLSGGLGVDTLTGGAGRDTFRFTDTVSIDTVKDFKAADLDRIDLSYILQDVDTATQAIRDFVSFRSNGAGGSIMSVDIDGAGAGAKADVAVFEGVTNLDATQLLLNNQLIV